MPPLSVPAPPGAASPWRRFEKASFAAGTALLVWLLVRVGPVELERELGAVGWGFLLVVALQGLPILLNTLSWRLLLPPARRVSLRELLPMLLAGESVNAVSPVGVVGGELVRVSLLRRRVPTTAAVGAVSLAATAQFAGQVLFILCGLPFALLLVRRPAWRLAIVLLGTAIVLFLGAVLVLSWSPERRDALRRAASRFAWFERLWARVPVAAREGVGNGLEVFRERPGAFGRSVAAALVAWQIGVVETLLVLFLLGHPVSLASAIAIEVLAVTVEAVLFFVPARMGTQEGGRVLIFAALGLDPAAGLALGLVRRARELVWAIPGLAILGAFQRSARGAAPGYLAPPDVTPGGQPLPD